MEVSETNLKIERNVKGKDGAPEIMEFVLEKPKKVE